MPNVRCIQINIRPHIIYNKVEHMINISRAAKLLPAIHPHLLYRSQAFMHHDGDELPRQYNFRFFTKQQRKILYGPKIKPKMQERFHDVLTLPSQDGGLVADLFVEMLKRNVPISAENVCMLIHQFIQNGIMTKETFDKLEAHAYRHKGQYQLRSLYGGLRGAILYNRFKLMNFFWEQYSAHSKKFTALELLELGETILLNKQWSLEQKKEYWAQNLKADFCQAINIIDQGSIKLMGRCADMLTSLQEYDEETWEGLIRAMDNKKGWGRILIIEKLYPVSGTFESAKNLFDKYYEESFEDTTWTELRYYTPLELIKIAEDNPSDFWPKQRTIVPQGEDPEQWNIWYEEFLQSGSVKEEAQIIKDKSMSFGYAIKDRYESMQSDNVDMSSLTKQQFSELFGNYDDAMKVLKDEEREGESLQQPQGEEPEE